MTDWFEGALRDRFTDAAAGLPVEADLVEPVRDRYGRRRSARLVLVGTLAATAVVAGVVLLVRPDPAPVVAAPVPAPSPVTRLDPAVAITLPGHRFSMPVGFRVTQEPMPGDNLMIGDAHSVSYTAVAQLPDPAATRSRPPVRVILSYGEGGLPRHERVGDWALPGSTARSVGVGSRRGTLASLGWATVRRECTPMPRHGTSPGIRCEGPWPKVQARFRLSPTTVLSVDAYGLTEQQVLDVLASGL